MSSTTPAQANLFDDTARQIGNERHRALRRGLTSFVVLGILWELTGRYILTNKLFFVPLSDVIIAAAHLWSTGELQHHMAVSFTELAMGIALAIVIGVPIGIISGVSRTFRDYSDLMIAALYATPLVAIAPLLVLWLGIGPASKAAVVFLTAVFPILINTSAGILATDAVLVEVSQSFGGTRFQTIRKVMVPAALPFILTGMRLAIGRGIVGVVVGEILGSQAGLGHLILVAGQSFDVPNLFVGVITLAIAGISLTYLAQLAEQYVTRWRRVVLE